MIASKPNLAVMVGALVLGASAGMANASYCSDGKTVTFAGINWQSGAFVTEVMKTILSDGYDCKVDAIPGNSVTLEQATANNDVQIFAEEWVGRSEVWNKATEEGKVTTAGKTFVGSKEGWFVPRYLIEGDAARGIKPVAPDLKSVSQLSEPQYVKLFADPEEPSKGRFLNCPSGWTCEGISTAKLEAYKLDGSYVNFRPGTGTALDAALSSAYLQGLPVLLYYWSPNALKAKYGDSLLDQPEDVWLADIREFATSAMMEVIRQDLALLNVHMDVFASEKALYGTGRIEAAIDRLRSMDLIYEGVLEPPKGKTPEDWEPRQQTLFRSTSHGDDVDRPVKKSDGAWTYFAPDIAYHWDKIDRGFDQLIDVFGADHGGYVKRMTAAVKALSNGRVALDVKLIQLVKLFKNGEPFKMSKRAGTFVTLRDVVEQAGADVTRFHMLTRKNDAALDFDFDKVLEQSKDNPVWYVQYASARVNSVLRKAADLGVATEDAALAKADLALLDHPAELELARKVAEWPRTVEIAARANEPHRIAFFLYDIASDLHSLWNRGNDEMSLRFVQEGDLAATSAKIALVRSVGVVISAGLGILGVTPAKEMR